MAKEQYSLLLKVVIDMSNNDFPLHLNKFFLNGKALTILVAKDYGAVDMIFANEYGFHYPVTRYRSHPKITMVHAMYSSITSRVMSHNWKRGRSRKELETFCVEVCQSRKEVVFCPV